MKRIFTIITTIAMTLTGWSQANFGALQGVVTDATTKKPVEAATVLIKKDGISKGGTFTDPTGKYYKGGLEPGYYQITIKYLGYPDAVYDKVQISPNSTQFLNVALSQNEQVLKTAVATYQRKIMDPDKNQTTMGKEEITKLATRSLGAIVALSSAANSTSAGISFMGQRPDATAYFVDGVRVIGSAGMPQVGQDQIDVIQSGIPAQYGDFTGGAISITSRGPTRGKFRSIEAITSTLLDGYNYNQVEGGFARPLIIKNKGGGDDEFVLLGVQLAGNVNWTKDPNPGYGGIVGVNDDVLRDIEANPLVANPTGPGLIYSSMLLTEEDLVRQKARTNAESLTASLVGKLEFQPNKNTTFTVGGTYNYANRRNWGAFHSLLNNDMNSRTIVHNRVGYVRFLQRIENKNMDDKDSDKKPLFTNAFYFIRFDYQLNNSTTFDNVHQDRVFEYGHIGNFTRYRTPIYSYNNSLNTHVDQNGDTVVRQGYFELAGFGDTLLTFQRSEFNPLRANYTQNFFESAGERGDRVFSDFQVQQGLGLMNGFAPQATYSLWSNPGALTSNFGRNMQERWSVMAMGEASLNLKNKHDLQMGVYMEGTIFSGYNLNANGLWTLMPLMANRHIQNLDKNLENGITLGGFHSYDRFGTFVDTINYNVRVDKDQQSDFDRNLREQLISSGARDVYGNLYNETSFIDVNSLNPSDLTLGMFSANDLLNQGNSYVNYFGYDYLGNRTRQRFSVNDFIKDSANRGVGSFMPLYQALWLQDKFIYKDLIIRVGVRIERYDANQPVLNDRYSFFPITTARAVSDDPVLSSLGIRPENIGDDFKVYVDDKNNPTQIIGYRNGDQWYDKEGAQIANPDLLANQTVSGRIQPFIQGEEEFSSATFRDYKPVINVLPRIWFSFPINSDANFFANYDVLTQRPNDGLTFSPFTDYYFMERRQGGTIGNAELQPRVTTSYELGFKQKLTESSALQLIASYRETRGDYALVRINQAYPITYFSYSNLDFSTVKNFRAEYEIRGQKNVSLRANYALLFADGTGSNANAAASLVQVGLPNLRTMYPMTFDVRHQITAILDYRYGDGQLYNGPVWFGKRVFENAGANFIVNASSGEPYTANSFAVPNVAVGSATRSPIKGNPFGSRLPWQFNVDANFQKEFSINKKNHSVESYTRPNYNFVVFLWIQNLLNTRNIRNVYSYSGLATDDGWLSSPQGQQQIREQVNAQSYVDLYNARVNWPYNFLAPRTIRLGCRMAF